MQPTQIPAFPQPPIAAMPQLREKPRLGLPSKNHALNPGINEHNSTVAIGMRVGLALNAARQSGLARYYDSRTGTFCSADPLAGDPSDPQSWNRYPYGRNNPITITDPSGQSWWSDLLIGVGVAAAIYFAPEIFPALADGGGGAAAGFTPVLHSAAEHALYDAALSGVGADVGASTGAGLGSAIAGGAMSAAAAQATDQPKPQQANGPITPTPTPCQQKTLNAINKQFGTNGNASNISPSSSPNPTFGGGQVNTNFSFNSGLTAAQFNAIQPGRYAPSGFWGLLTGYGPSLHVVAGPSSLDPTAMQFANSNVGGNLSASFTAHIDSAWANNPIGAALHWKIDVHGHSTRNPCP